MHSGLSRADRKGGRTTGARADKPTTSWKVRQIVRQATTITHVLFFFFSTGSRSFSFLPGPRNSIWDFLDLSGSLDFWLLVFNLGLPASRFSGIFLRFQEYWSGRWNRFGLSLEWDWRWNCNRNLNNRKTGGLLCRQEHSTPLDKSRWKKVPRLQRNCRVGFGDGAYLTSGAKWTAWKRNYRTKGT
jgi:hypothetical protein